MRHIGTVATMVIILGLPVWLWAGDKTGVGLQGIDCMIWTDPEAGVHVEGKDCHTLRPMEPKESACYLRMREAMRMMNTHLITAREAKRAKTLPVNDITIWYQVINDCVEGGK